MEFSTIDFPICSTCGVQYEREAPLNSCKICDDPRQYVPPSGQSWTSLKSLQSSTKSYRNVFTPDPNHPNLITIHTVPKLAIGQRAFLCLGDGDSGNVLWDCITYLDEETVRHVNELGGIHAIVISHPHYFSTSAQWAEVFNCDLFIAAEDEEWLGYRGDSSRLKIWKGDKLPLPHARGPKAVSDDSDVIAVKTGGHFPGSCVLWWKSMKKLLIADTIMIVPSGLYQVDRLPDEIYGIWKAIKDLDFEDTHGAFAGQEIRGNSKRRVLESAQIIVRASGHLQHPLLNEA